MPENWDESRLYFTKAVESMEARLVRLEQKVDSLVTAQTRTDTELKIKSGVWGILGGILVAISSAVISMLKH